MRMNVNIDRVTFLPIAQTLWAPSAVLASQVMLEMVFIVKVLKWPSTELIYNIIDKKFLLTNADIDECQDPSIAARCVENAECCNLPAHFACKYCKYGWLKV